MTDMQKIKDQMNLHHKIGFAIGVLTRISWQSKDDHQKNAITEAINGLNYVCDEITNQRLYCYCRESPVPDLPSKADEEKILDQQFSEFNKKFNESQKDLPPEFAKILHDNLWDLLA
jgi:hypothetical protein